MAPLFVSLSSERKNGTIRLGTKIQTPLDAHDERWVSSMSSEVKWMFRVQDLVRAVIECDEQVGGRRKDQKRG